MKALLAGLLAVPLFTWAAPQASDGAAGGPPAGAEERFERMEKRMRLARALGVAEALDLSDAQANQVREILNRFDDRRRPLMHQMFESMRVVRQAANGDAAAQAQVDQAVNRVFDARAQLQAIDREVFQALSKGLTPEKRARLLVFLNHFHMRFRMGAHQGMGTGPGAHPGHGPGARQRGTGPGPGPAMGGGDDCPGCDAEP